MRTERLSEDDPLSSVADEVEAGSGPIALVRPGHRDVVLVSADDWAEAQQRVSEDETAWWRRDSAERAARGEAPGDGEHQILDEQETSELLQRLIGREHGAGAA